MVTRSTCINNDKLITSLWSINHMYLPGDYLVFPVWPPNVKSECSPNSGVGVTVFKMPFTPPAVPVCYNWVGWSGRYLRQRSWLHRESYSWYWHSETKSTPPGPKLFPHVLVASHILGKCAVCCSSLLGMRLWRHNRHDFFTLSACVLDQIVHCKKQQI